MAVDREALTSNNRAIPSALAAIVILVMACDVSYMLPSGPVFPTSAPGAVETIVAGTARAAQTQTAERLPASVTPTFTATITRTPAPSATLTPTFIIHLRTSTPRGAKTATEPPDGSGTWACRLLSQDPEDGSKIAPKANFDAVWEVRNTGTKTWDENGVDFVYVSGRKMHEAAIYDLSDTVKPGDSIDLIVDMVAPKDPGTYNTEWALRRSGDLFCHVTLKIIVK